MKKTLVRALLLAVLLLVVAAPSALADMRTVTAREDPSFTGWAGISSVGCNETSAYWGGSAGSPYCVVEQTAVGRSVTGIWTYSYTSGRWIALRFPTQAYVYATPASSQFAWIWTTGHGFSVVDKRHVSVRFDVIPGCAACT